MLVARSSTLIQTIAPQLSCVWLLLGSISGCDVHGGAERDLSESRTYGKSSLPLGQSPQSVTSYGKDKIETSSSGAAYVDECRKLGVPVPEYVLEGYDGFKSAVMCSAPPSAPRCRQKTPAT